jgi:hypothetical protein
MKTEIERLYDIIDFKQETIEELSESILSLSEGIKNLSEKNMEYRTEIAQL